MFGCRNWSKTCLDLDAVWFSTLAALAVQCWKSDIIIGYLCSLVLSAGGQTLSIYYNLIVALVQFKYSCFLSGRQPVCVCVSVLLVVCLVQYKLFYTCITIQQVAWWMPSQLQHVLYWMEGGMVSWKSNIMAKSYVCQDAGVEWSMAQNMEDHGRMDGWVGGWMEEWVDG